MRVQRSQPEHCRASLPESLRKEGAFIGELLKHGEQSIETRRREEPGFGGRIDILTDITNSAITFVDDGVGMKSEEIEEALGAISRSSTVHEMEDLLRDRAATIESFAMAILSASGVAETIEVITRRLGSETGDRWTHETGRQFSHLERSQKARVGCMVKLTLLPDYAANLDEEFIRNAVKKNAGVMAVPILVNGDGPINDLCDSDHAEEWDQPYLPTEATEYQPIPPKRSLTGSVRYHLRGRGTPLVYHIGDD